MKTRLYEIHDDESAVYTLESTTAELDALTRAGWSIHGVVQAAGQRPALVILCAGDNTPTD